MCGYQSIVTFVVAMTMTVAISMVMTMFFVIFATSTFIIVPVMRHVLVVVPVIPHKVDRSTTCVVLSAMLLPMLFVARWHMQVDRPAAILWRLLNDHRLLINQLRLRRITQIDLSVKTRLTHTDGHAHVSSKCRDRTYGERSGE